MTSESGATAEAALDLSYADRRAAAGVPRIRPDFLCRVSGLPASTFARQRFPKLPPLLDELYREEEELAERKGPVVDLLHRAVGGEGDQARRRRLLGLKRRAFNLRPLAPTPLNDLGLDDADSAQLEAFRASLDRRERLLALFRSAYPEAVRHARARLKALLGDADFQKGLLLSSRSLSSVLDAYLESDDAAPSGRDEQIERGLLRYASRMAMKATPFGTFCAVIAGQFASDGGGGSSSGEPVRFVGDPRVKTSHVRLNKRLYSVLIEHLKTRTGVRRRLPVELNPTLEEEGTRLVFLTAVSGREVFQRLERNPVLDVIAGLLADRPVVIVQELIDALVADARVETTPEEAAEFVDRLAAVGFLRFRPGIREQDPDWDLPLGRLLRSMDDEHAGIVTALLADLRELVDAYATATVEHRRRLIGDIDRRIADALKTLQTRATLGGTPAMYEDASAAARLEVGASAEAVPALRELAQFTSIAVAAAWLRTEQATMRHFFDEHYEDAERVPLVRFYEDYHRRFYKEHLERVRRAKSAPASLEREHREDVDGNEGGGEAREEYNAANPFDLDLNKAVSGASARVTALLERRCREAPTAVEISIGAREFAEALDLPAQPAICRSLSLFVQLVPTADGSPYVVLCHRRSFAGYGKYFSRFLYMLPDAVRQRVYRDNLALCDAYLAEICGDAAFNANLHPPLLRWEVSYPTGEAGNLQDQLSCADLAVERDPADPNALCLRHRPTGQLVIPVDLGFLNPTMRPPLYQLLSHFSPPANFVIAFPPLSDEATEGGGVQAGISPAGDGHVQAAGVRQRPRILFGDRLVLARRCWFVPGPLFPRWTPGVDLGDYFVAVNRWRRLHGIPDQAYVRIVPQQASSGPRAGVGGAGGHAGGSPPPPPVANDIGPETNEGAGNRATPTEGARRTWPSRDFRKPQFMDFHNPLLVHLFGRLPGPLERFSAVLEERFPGEEALPQHGGEAYATELVLVMDFPQRVPPSEGQRASPVGASC